MSILQAHPLFDNFYYFFSEVMLGKYEKQINFFSDSFLFCCLYGQLRSRLKSIWIFIIKMEISISCVYKI